MVSVTTWRLIGALWLALCCSGVSIAEPTKLYDIDLQAQSVADALNGLSEQTGVPIVFPYDLVINRTSNSVVGRYTVLEALDALLRNTGVSGGLSDKGVLTISMSKSGTLKPGETFVTNNQNTQNFNRSFVARLSGITALIASAAATFSASAEEMSTDQRNLDEVVVSAQKKSERLQDVPVPVTVLDTQSLAENDQTRLQDYFTLVPGLSLITSGPNNQLLAIRGITAGNSGNNPTVGMTIDDVRALSARVRQYRVA
jgi:iron complex outermembrane recepter protein